MMDAVYYLTRVRDVPAGSVSDFRQTPMSSPVMKCDLKFFRVKCVRTANKVFVGGERG